MLHLGPDVEALHAAIDNLGDNAGREAGGQGMAPLAVRTTRRPKYQTVTKNFGSYNPIIIFHRRKFLTMTVRFLTLTGS